MDMDQRLGRLREPRFVLLYLVGGALSLFAGIALFEYSNGALREVAGAIALGGVALSAQVAKGRWRTDPRRAAWLVTFGVVSGVVFAALSR